MILTIPLSAQTLLITVDSILDGTTTQEFRLVVQRALAFGTREFVFDCTKLTGIDTAGTEQLTIIAQLIRKYGGTLELLNPAEPIKDRFEQSHISRVAPIRLQN